MISPDEIWAGISASTLVIVGIAYGDSRARQLRMEKDITTIKEALGLENGNSVPAFVRTTECANIEKVNDAAIKSLEDRVEFLEKRAWDV